MCLFHFYPWVLLVLLHAGNNGGLRNELPKVIGQSWDVSLFWDAKARALFFKVPKTTSGGYWGQSVSSGSNLGRTWGFYWGGEWEEPFPFTPSRLGRPPGWLPDSEWPSFSENSHQFIGWPPAPTNEPSNSDPQPAGPLIMISSHREGHLILGWLFRLEQGDTDLGFHGTYLRLRRECP